MNKEWITPKAEIEGFTANEFCSTCWSVGCVTAMANHYENDHGNTSDVNHNMAHCGNPVNQVIKDIDDNGTADIMQEVGTDGLGTLNCTIYPDDSYSTPMPVADVQPGDYIYWTTQEMDAYGNVRRTWHHQGGVNATTKGHPNRS